MTRRIMQREERGLPPAPDSWPPVTQRPPVMASQGSFQRVLGTGSHACTHTHTPIHTHTQTLTYSHIHTHKHILSLALTCTHTQMHTLSHTQTHTSHLQNSNTVLHLPAFFT